MALSPLPYRVIKSKLEAAGSIEVSQNRSHVKFVKETEQEIWTTIVPHHKEVSVGTLRSILRQAGISPDEFEDL